MVEVLRKLYVCVRVFFYTEEIPFWIINMGSNQSIVELFFFNIMYVYDQLNKVLYSNQSIFVVFQWIMMDVYVFVECLYNDDFFQTKKNR